MQLTTTDFKQKEFGKAIVFARTSGPVTLTTRNQEDLVLIKASELAKYTDVHLQADISKVKL